MDYLPESFKNKMKELLGSEYEEFLNCYNSRHNSGLRVNTLKLSPERFKEISPYSIEQVPWIENGFYYRDTEQPARHPYYYAGLYYIQEPSAMTPASLLPVQPGDRVADLCAAPGGKSTELGAKLKGRGMLVANDISNSRAKALLKNIELFGISNALVISEAPAKLCDYFEGFFDKILVDAPCSGEGMFRKSSTIIKNWEQYGVEYYNKLQKEILPCAVRMLRPGGMLLYSTCTFSREENEGTLKFVLESYPDMHVVKAIDDSDPRFHGFCHARPELVDGPAEIANALRIYPHRVKGEGHFVALLKKDRPSDSLADVNDSTAFARSTTISKAAANTEDNSRQLNEYGNTRSLNKNISSETWDFLSSLRFPIPAERLIVREDRVFLLPEQYKDTKGLRVMRSGLLLGEMKKNRFEPSQALACCLRMEDYDNCLDISAESSDAVRYLKCESITVPGSCRDGWTLVCADGYPLGWGKSAGGVLKNKYLPGWRWL